jgi:hypothetical protein
MNESNEILEELWNVRREIEAENNYDVETICKKYYSRQNDHPSEYIVCEPKHIDKSKAA